MRALALKLLLSGVLAMLALLTAAWLWSSSAGSLATLLTQLNAFLPAGQTLQTSGVQGSLHQGGRIAQLRWSQGDLSVEATDVVISWTLRPLLDKEWRLTQLRMATLTVQDHRPFSPTEPKPALTELMLPLHLTLPFQISRFSLQGNTAFEASELSGTYTFDSSLHSIHKGYGHISSGTYQLDGTLQAAAPMALALQLQGQVHSPMPGADKPLNVAASASLTGHLSGADALLTLQASLTPEQSKAARAMQAQVTAQIAPWQTQPLRQASAQWQALNLAALWPQAPQTLLSGQADVHPSAPGWQGQVALTNALAGPWNLQRLPLQTLQATFSHAQDQWAVTTLNASAGGGRITGTGQLHQARWQGSANATGLNPAAIDTRLAPASLSGTLQAQPAGNGIGFSAHIKAGSAPAPQALGKSTPAHVQAIQLQSLQTQGLWAGGVLSLTSLNIQAEAAQLLGQLTYNTHTQAAQGKLNLTLPGLQASVDGQIAPTSGQGQLSVNVLQVLQTTAWLKRLPLANNPLQHLQLDGQTQLEAQWQGGWQQLGQSLHVEGALRIPQLDWRAPAPAANLPPVTGQLRQAQLQVAGTLPALTLSSQGQLQINQQQLRWQTRASAGQRQPGLWQASVTALQLQVQAPTHPGLWTLTLGDNSATPPLALDWQGTGTLQQLSVGHHTAQLTGPMPGQAQLSWQPLLWSKPAGQPAQWQSQGQISQLPLAWLDAFSGKSLSELGLSSDLLLAGSWEARQASSLSVSAMLERSNGDVRLHTDAKNQAPLPAQLQEARLNVNLTDNDLAGSLRWTSQRAGHALLAFSTQLQALDAGWQWPQDAPVGGSLQLQLPPMDAWTALAPPGWRMRGTLDANATLTGTRQQPQWAGTLQAQNLAVRSVADGIDLQQGSLLARLDGQQLHLEDFTLYGAGGAAGGHVKLTGLAQWLPARTPNTPLAQQLAVSLQAQFNALRVSNRSDRLLSVSGELNGHLKDSTMQLRGKLSADHALITLPSETAPKLGDDVVVRPSAQHNATLATQSPRKTPTAANHPATPGSRITPDLQITLDLGSDFQLRGRGLVTQLAGQLELQSQASQPISLVGSIRTRRGTYQAYGQRLDIEQGELTFFGPPDVAVLNILAIRPQLSQRVGVQVLGSTLSPVVRLYAEPELPEADKLAWLVLGRSASGRGGEAALLQQAAMALLGGNDGVNTGLMQSLGLDELGFQGGSGDSASGTTITLGKRLGKDIYVAYESGLAGTMGVFTIFYDLSRRLTLRAQTGEQSALDVIWTQRYD